MKGSRPSDGHSAGAKPAAGVGRVVRLAEPELARAFCRQITSPVTMKPQVPSPAAKIMIRPGQPNAFPE